MAQNRPRHCGCDIRGHTPATDNQRRPTDDDRRRIPDGRPTAANDGRPTNDDGGRTDTGLTAGDGRRTTTGGDDTSTPADTHGLPLEGGSDGRGRPTPTARATTTTGDRRSTDERRRPAADGRRPTTCDDRRPIDNHEVQTRAAAHCRRPCRKATKDAMTQSTHDARPGPGLTSTARLGTRNTQNLSTTWGRSSTL